MMRDGVDQVYGSTVDVARDTGHLPSIIIATACVIHRRSLYQVVNTRLTCSFRMSTRVCNGVRYV